MCVRVRTCAFVRACAAARCAGLVRAEVIGSARERATATSSEQLHRRCCNVAATRLHPKRSTLHPKRSTLHAKRSTLYALQQRNENASPGNRHLVEVSKVD